MRRLLLLFLLLCPVPAWAQLRFTESVPRTTLAADLDRCTPGRTLLATDGQLEIVLDVSTAHRQDPSRRVALRIEASPTNTNPWTLVAGGETWGSPNAVLAAPPSVRANLRQDVPEGWFVRVCARTGSQPVSVGATVNIYTGARLAIVPPAHHSVAYDNAAGTTGTSVGTLTTGSFTIGSNANRACVMMIGNGQSGITVSSTTCGTVSGTSAAARTANGSYSVHAWYAVAPSSGSQTASVTFSDTWGTALGIAAMTYDDVNQSSPVADVTGNTGTGTALSVTVPNAVAGGYVVGGFKGTGGGTDTPGGTTTERYDGTRSFIVGADEDGADGGVLEYTGEFSGTWVVVGLRLVEDTSGAAGCTGGLMLLGAGKCE
jgi:hypothetical protein